MSNHMTFIIAGALVLLATASVNAQDQTATRSQDSTAVASPEAEMTFDEIQIEGAVEKPNVTILRNRLSSDFETVDFVERSFVREMLALPDKDVLFDANFESIGKTRDVKRILKEILNSDAN